MSRPTNTRPPTTLTVRLRRLGPLTVSLVAAGNWCRRRDVAIELCFETHSLTVDNEMGIATGWLPGELSTRGRELPRALDRRYRDRELACTFVSDLARAVETAEIA